MTKVGRNDPCPCGSGKKYKACCLQKDEAQAREVWAATNAELHVGVDAVSQLFQAEQDLEDFDAEKFTGESNAVINLIDAGKLDEAESAARALLATYPQVHDGFDRLGMVYEARGDLQQAAHWYRQCLAFVREHPELYEPAVEERYERLIAKMEVISAAS
jgi:tetratricopeptide (TPR) repeat protein